MNIVRLCLALLLFISCSKDEPNQLNWYVEQKGYVDGVVTGDVSTIDWKIFQQPPHTSQTKFKAFNFRKNNPDAPCDSLINLSISSYIEGKYGYWGFNFYFLKEFPKAHDTIEFFHREDWDTPTFDVNKFCKNLPKSAGGLSNYDARLSSYDIVDTSTNFFVINYISSDSVVGSLHLSFVSNRDDFFFQNYKDVDRHITFDCKKFIAVKDTSQ